jgi:C-terminal processing protease CtpA/Prc
MPFSAARFIVVFASLVPFATIAHSSQVYSSPDAQFEYASTASGYLGVDLRDVDELRAQQLKLGGVGGAEIVALDHDAPACKAGLHTGDVITRVNGEPISNADQLRRLMRELPAGRHVTLTVNHNGKSQDVHVQLADREALARQAWKKHFHVSDSVPMVDGFAGGNGFLRPGLVMPPGGSTERIGVYVRPMSAQLAAFFGAKDGAGLLVESVDQDSPAAAAGIKAGDVITRANGNPVASAMDLIGAVRSSNGRPVQVTLLRDHREQSNRDRTAGQDAIAAATGNQQRTVHGGIATGAPKSAAGYAAKAQFG